jgi:hypothetical protein
VLDVAMHARRLAQQHLERHVHRLIPEQGIVDHEIVVRARLATTANGQRSRSHSARKSIEARTIDGST